MTANDQPTSRRWNLQIMMCASPQGRATAIRGHAIKLFLEFIGSG
jgi:hypothetical protein